LLVTISICLISLFPLRILFLLIVLGFFSSSSYSQRKPYDDIPLPLQHCIILDASFPHTSSSASDSELNFFMGLSVSREICIIPFPHECIAFPLFVSHLRF